MRVKPVATGQVIRLGGLVKAGSLQRDKATQHVQFIVTDTVVDIAVEYDGLLPNLFREGQGVVAEGVWTNERGLQASTVLAKHDERYMSPDVAEALKRAGKWKGQ